MPSNTTLPLFRTTDEGKRVVVSFPNGTVLTEANAEEFGKQLAALLSGREGSHVWLDLAGVSMLSSVALAKFVTFNGKVRAAGGRLTLGNPNPTVWQIFRITRLDTVLEFAKPDALSA